MIIRILGALTIALLFSHGAMAQNALAKYGITELGPGFEISTAFVNFNKRDGESYKKVLAARPDRFMMSYNNTLGTVVNREVLTSDRRTSRTYVVGFSSEMPQRLPGTTALGLSTSTFNELKTRGTVNMSLMVDVNQKVVHGGLDLIGTVEFPLVINNIVVRLPALHARGRFKKGKVIAEGDFYVADDFANPIMLRYDIVLGGMRIRRGRENKPLRLNVVRMYSGASQQAVIEQALRTQRRYELYGIHFNFASAKLRPVVRSLLNDIAVTLKNNPGWRLSIQGHTDAIGGQASNQVLSERRAASVRAELIARHDIRPGRLETIGFGLERPKSTNKTLQGRAINRRVELVRLDRSR